MKVTGQLKPLVAAVGAAGLLLGQPASAQTLAYVHLDQLLVQAERSQASQQARVKAQIDQAELRSRQAASVAEAVSGTVNVITAGGPRAATQTVNIRGLSGNKVLQTVDGVRQMFTSGHRPSYFIDPALLERIDLVKGPASALWGSGALGGVVAQRTLRPDSVLAGGQSLGGFVRAGVNSNTDARQGTAVLAGRQDSARWLLGVYQHSSHDIELGNGQSLDNSASDDRGFLGHWQQQINPDLALEISLQQGERDGAVPSNATAGLSSSNFLLNRNSRNQLASVNLDYNPDNPLINSQSKVYWNSTEIDESRISDGRQDQTRMRTYGLELSNHSQFEGFGLLYGLDAFQEDFSAQRSGSHRPTPPDAQNTLAGAYLQGQFALALAWQLNLTGRYDSFTTEAANLDQQRTDSAFSPSAALSWQAHPQLQLTLRHDRAFRAPTAEELYSTGTHFCMGPGFCNTFIANPDLAPEKAANTELMADWSVLDTRRYSWTLAASVFENRVDNFIEQQVSSPSFFPVMDPGNTRYRNIASATLRGFELNSEYHYGRFELALGYGQTRGTDDASAAPLSGIPADSFKARAQYAWLGGDLVTGTRLTYTRQQARTTDNEDYQGYTLADLYASWTPAAYPQLELDLTVNNLTDRYYRQAWAQLYEPGREVIASLTYHF